MITIKKKFDFHNFAEHLQKARGISVKNQRFNFLRWQLVRADHNEWPNRIQ